MKKASLSLSVNAIVILILAITMLGLGIAFIKNMFGQATDNLAELISSEPEAHKPSSSDPMTLSKENIITTSGETGVIKVAVFNPTNTNWSNVSINSSCIDPRISFDDYSMNREIEINSFENFILQLNNIQGPPDSYMCQVESWNISVNPLFLYQKDIIINIKD